MTKGTGNAHSPGNGARQRCGHRCGTGARDQAGKSCTVGHQGGLVILVGLLDQQQGCRLGIGTGPAKDGSTWRVRWVPGVHRPLIIDRSAHSLERIQKRAQVAGALQHVAGELQNPQTSSGHQRQGEGWRRTGANSVYRTEGQKIGCAINEPYCPAAFNPKSNSMSDLGHGMHQALSTQNPTSRTSQNNH